MLRKRKQKRRSTEGSMALLRICLSINRMGAFKYDAHHYKAITREGNSEKNDFITSQSRTFAEDITKEIEKRILFLTSKVDSQHTLLCYVRLTRARRHDSQNWRNREIASALGMMGHERWKISSPAHFSILRSFMVADWYWECLRTHIYSFKNVFGCY